MKQHELKPLQYVNCPEDRGDPAYQGVVMSFEDKVQKNHLGHEFVWVTVRHPRGSKHVWPSNRLSVA